MNILFLQEIRVIGWFLLYLTVIFLGGSPSYFGLGIWMQLQLLIYFSKSHRIDTPAIIEPAIKFI